MNKLKYILAILLMGSIYSCRKECVKPCDNEDKELMYIDENVDSRFYLNSENYNKESNPDSETEEQDDQATGSSSQNGLGSNDSDSDTSDDSAITDPNQDPDANKKKGKK